MALKLNDINKSHHNADKKTEKVVHDTEFWCALVALLSAAMLFAFCCVNITEKKSSEKKDFSYNSQGENFSMQVDEFGNRPFVRPDNLKSSPINTDRIDSQYPNDLTRALKVNYVNSEKKVAYITFDDGPSKNTSDILNILERYNVKATFFIIGSNAQQHPDLVKRIFDEGHTVANHSYSHVYSSIYASPESLRDEIYQTEDVLSEIIGKQNITKLFRFPGGSTGGRQSKLKGYMEKIGYKYVDWNALCGDGERSNYTYDYCISRIHETCSDTGDIIVLLHDTNAKSMTVAALPEIIEYLISLGYSFERIVP